MANQLLFSAIDTGYTEMVVHLLNEGVNIHDNNDYALRLATLRNNAVIVNILLNAGADAHALFLEMFQSAAKQVHKN